MSRSAFASLLLLGLCVTRPAFADTPVAVVANLGFHSAFWINLHHTLYAAAWARRPDTGSRRLIGPMPAPLVAPVSDDERTAWDAAVDYYDRNVADRDLLTGQGMARMKVALAAEDLARRLDRRRAAWHTRARCPRLPPTLLARARQEQSRMD